MLFHRCSSRNFRDCFILVLQKKKSEPKLVRSMSEYLQIVDWGQNEVLDNVARTVTIKKKLVNRFDRSGYNLNFLYRLCMENKILNHYEFLRYTINETYKNKFLRCFDVIHFLYSFTTPYYSTITPLPIMPAARRLVSPLNVFNARSRVSMIQHWLIQCYLYHIF